MTGTGTSSEMVTRYTFGFIVFAVFAAIALPTLFGGSALAEEGAKATLSEFRDNVESSCGSPEVPLKKQKDSTVAKQIQKIEMVDSGTTYRATLGSGKQLEVPTVKCDTVRICNPGSSGKNCPTGSGKLKGSYMRMDLYYKTGRLLIIDEKE